MNFYWHIVINWLGAYYKQWQGGSGQDPWRFGTDPDLRIRTYQSYHWITVPDPAFIFQDANQKKGSYELV